MRDLTPEECEFIAGGDGNNPPINPEYPPEIVVVASPPPYQPPWTPPYIPPQPPPPIDCGCEGGGGGGGGGGSGGEGDGVHERTSPGGVTYEYDANLSPAQLALVDKIVDYGQTHNYTAAQIEIAVRQGFYESSLGTITSNPTNSNVQGLYQYDAQTWADRGHGGMDRSSANDQIAAFFGDIRYYETRYANGIANGQIPASLPFEHYMEVKHHLGSNSTNWTSPVIQDYQNKSNALGFDL